MDIALTQGRMAIIDDADEALISPYRWHVKAGKRLCYAETIVYESGRAQTLYMHRLILGVNAKGMLVDHINGDGLDNRRANLRLATHAENVRNRRAQSNNTSGFKGVEERTDAHSWRARIKHNGTTLNLGTYPDAASAARAYNRAAARLFGFFARLNLVAPEAPLPRVSCEDAVACAAALGHSLGPVRSMAGMQVRQCVTCLCSLVERKDGAYGGSALASSCDAERPALLARGYAHKRTG